MTEYTLHSRIRRAMTCVYWEPKSRMTICSSIEKGNFLPARKAFGEKKALPDRLCPRRADRRRQLARIIEQPKCPPGGTAVTAWRQLPSRYWHHKRASCRKEPAALGECTSSRRVR